jgi:16S rRNA (guanine966-N2)-methyltransferase
MRIIAGTARSLPLKTIEGTDTRPTTDKIKETLFNVLQMDIPGAYFLDLFAGSGQIGLEALSRGAAYAVFVENNRKAAKCIEDNIAFTKFTTKSKLMISDAISAMHQMEGKYTFDLIFMDPPYRRGMEKEVLKYLAGSALLKPESRIIVEASLDTDFSYLKELGYTLEKCKRYKTNMHMFIQRGSKSDEESNISG